MTETDPKSTPRPQVGCRGHGRGDRRSAGRLVLLGVLGSVGWLLPATAAAAASATVQVGTVPTYGAVLEAAQGLPLYTLDSDHGGQSTCTGSCLQAWPPLTMGAGQAPTAGPGVPGTVATAVQSDGRIQVTYDGAPLYTFVGDTAGVVTGQGVAGFTVVEVRPLTVTTTTSATPATVPGAGSGAGVGPTPTPTPTPTQTPTPAPTPEAAAAGSVPPSSPASATPPAAASLAVTGAGPSLAVLAGIGAAGALGGGLGLAVGRRRHRPPGSLSSR